MCCCGVANATSNCGALITAVRRHPQLPSKMAAPGAEPPLRAVDAALPLQSAPLQLCLRGGWRGLALPWGGHCHFEL